MKGFCNAFLVLFVCLSLLNDISASTTPQDNRWTIGVYSSAGPSAHPNTTSVRFAPGYCGVYRLQFHSKKGISSNQIFLSVFYAINERQKVSIGLGSSSYLIKADFSRTFEPLSDDLVRMQSKTRYSFVHYHLGYEYQFSANHLINPFVAGRIHYEHQGASFNEPGFGSQLLAGFRSKSFKGFSLSTSIYGKTTFSREIYYYDSNFIRFSPYGYGIEMGLQYSF